MDNYKIIRLSINNLKKISAIDITPKDSVVKITGKNGQGKSTILDSIEYAITGKIPDDVISHGQEKSKITIDMGDLLIEKSITQKDKYLRIKDKNGNEIKSPQSFMDSLTGRLNIAFDPLAFMSLEKVKQKEVFLKILGIDFDAIDKDYQDKYNQRTVENRILKNLEVKLNGFGKVEKVEPVNISDVTKKMTQLQGNINLLETKKSRLELISKRYEEIKKEIKAIEEERDAIYEELKINTFGDIEKKIGELRDNYADCDTEIKNIEETNKKAEQYKDYTESHRQYDSQKALVEKLNAEMELNRQEKQGLLNNAKLGSLTINDDGELVYKGNILSNISQSEKIKIGYSIASLLNPKIRVILIRDGSLLDNDSMKIIEEYSKSNNLQTWIEIVDDDNSVEDGIYIIDGEVV